MYVSQVKFSVDAIDDTDIVEDVLRPRVDSIGGQIKKVILSGTHLTPCIQVIYIPYFSSMDSNGYKEPCYICATASPFSSFTPKLQSLLVDGIRVAARKLMFSQGSFTTIQHSCSNCFILKRVYLPLSCVPFQKTIRVCLVLFICFRHVKHSLLLLNRM